MCRLRERNTRKRKNHQKEKETRERERKKEDERERIHQKIRMGVNKSSSINHAVLSCFSRYRSFYTLSFNSPHAHTYSTHTHTRAIIEQSLRHKRRKHEREPFFAQYREIPTRTHLTSRTRICTCRLPDTRPNASTRMCYRPLRRLKYSRGKKRRKDRKERNEKGISRQCLRA